MMAFLIVLLVVGCFLTYASLGFLMAFGLYQITGADDWKLSEIGGLAVALWPGILVGCIPWAMYAFGFKRLFDRDTLPERREFRKQQRRQAARDAERELERIYSEHPEWQVKV